MPFTTTSRMISFEIEDDARFLALLDSESHATDNAVFKPGNQTLYERLEHETKARDINYDGHFGAQVMFMLDEEDFTEENLAEIEATINRHLDWCQTLEVVEHVRARRAS
jgi:hypothetical protein